MTLTHEPPLRDLAPSRGLRLSGRTAELLTFCAVGGMAFVVDLVVYNVLRLGPLAHAPITAKVASVLVSMVAAWLGNRYLTFAAASKKSTLKEFLLFVAANAVGLGIASACLVVSHYVLGLTSPLADNLSANGVGLVLGTAFRYAAYRSVVFRA